MGYYVTQEDLSRTCHAGATSPQTREIGGGDGRQGGGPLYSRKHYCGKSIWPENVDGRGEQLRIRMIHSSSKQILIEPLSLQVLKIFYSSCS